MRFTYDDLALRYSGMTASVVCRCVAATPIVGGLSASDDGLRAFIKHHLGIVDGPEADAAFTRIKSEEMGEKPVPSETGELSERLTYGLNMLRRTNLGPYLGNWMIHANIKNAASRLGIFKEQRGSKGNMAEGGMVLPYGISKRDDRPDCIYLRNANGEPATTYFEEFKGRVQSPQGSVSITHHSECVPAGTEFAFEFKFILGAISWKDAQDMLALSMIVGLGSVKSLGNGKFRIIEAEFLEPVEPRLKKQPALAKLEEVAEIQPSETQKQRKVREKAMAVA